MMFNIAIVAGVMVCLAAIYCCGFDCGREAAIEHSDAARQLRAIRDAHLVQLRAPGRQILIISSCPKPAELLAIIEEHTRREHVHG